VLFIDAGASSIPLNGLMTAGGNFCTFSDDIRQTSQHRTTTSQGKSDQRVYGVDVKELHSACHFQRSIFQEWLK
jgi:hypothetical protein